MSRYPHITSEEIDNLVEKFINEIKASRVSFQAKEDRFTFKFYAKEVFWEFVFMNRVDVRGRFLIEYEIKMFQKENPSIDSDSIGLRDITQELNIPKFILEAYEKNKNTAKERIVALIELKEMLDAE